MSKSNETPSTPTGDDRNLVANTESAAAPELEEVVRQFWEKNRSLLMGLVVAILLAILGRNGWDAYQAGQIESAREEFAAAESDDQLKAFAADRAGTALAGVALLEVADKAFAEGNFDAALSGYDAAAAELADSVFADRVQLGRAMSQLLGEDEAAGQSALRDLANDTDVASAVRSEAIYHLASLALAAKNADELDALSTQIDAINPGSGWSQRILLMRSTLPADSSETDSDGEIAFESP
ncbi:tetratricopeptide repeat protein [Opitutaceae bacterium]|nr:tetratricopeptide repeat protein [Opitutaceae bacterium]MDB4473647.1 tetratricopeptide repeat protein [Opitutaceae bacterium]